MSRYAGAGASTFAPACTHQQPPSRHPTPPADAIHTSQGLRTSSCNTVGTTTTYGPPPYYVSHQHTKLPPLAVMRGPDYPSPVPVQVRALPSSTAKVRQEKKRPSSSSSRSNTATTDLTQPHYSPTHQHPPAPTNPPAPCPPTTPGMYKASAWVRAPGGSITLPPPPPPERVRVEGAYFALGTS